MAETNREYKDRLFKFIFGNPENKAWTLSLYNAVNGSSYTDPEEIQITTIREAVYMSMRNDLSFLIADTMNFYEAQSSYNPNMPMRYLIYAGMVYSNYVENPEYKINLYSSLQQKFPAPKLICFYDGLQAAEDKTILSLQDAFAENAESDISVKVTMLNINYGRNKELLEACQPLKEYSFFISEIRKAQKAGSDMDHAIGLAISNLPEDSLIKPFLLSNKAEVTRMCITEYDENRTMQMFKDEGRAEGRAEGEERLSILMSRLFAEGKVAEAQRAVNDAEYRKQLYKEYYPTA